MKEEKRLVLERRGRTWTYPLTTTREIRLYREYFDEYFCEYGQGGFRTPDDLTLESLPRGTYEVSVCLTSPEEKIERRTRLIAQRAIDTRQAVGDSEVLVRGSRNGVKITKRRILSPESEGVRFSLKNSWKRDRRVHAEGVFFLPGRNADKKNHALYYLVLRGRRRCFCVSPGSEEERQGGASARGPGRHRKLPFRLLQHARRCGSRRLGGTGRPVPDAQSR